VVRGAVRLEALDVDVLGLVVVPARLGPQRLAVAAVALSLPAEELVAAFGRIGIEVDARARLRRRQRELVETARKTAAKASFFIVNALLPGYFPPRATSRLPNSPWFSSSGPDVK